MRVERRSCNHEVTTGSRGVVALAGRLPLARVPMSRSLPASSLMLAASPTTVLQHVRANGLGLRNSVFEILSAISSPRLRNLVQVAPAELQISKVQRALSY